MQYEAERYQEILRDLMVKMWTAAEIRYEEFQSMDGMTDILANHGYQRGKGRIWLADPPTVRYMDRASQ